MHDQPAVTQIDSWQAAEHNAAAWMRHWGHPDARVTGGSADGGIDVGSNTALGQVKFEAAQVGAPAVQRLVGARGWDSHKQLFFFSGAGYSPQAVAYADSMGIALLKYDLAGRMTPANDTAAWAAVPPALPEAKSWRTADPPTPEGSGYWRTADPPTPEVSGYWRTADPTTPEASGYWGSAPPPSQKHAPADTFSADTAHTRNSPYDRAISAPPYDAEVAHEVDEGIAALHSSPVHDWAKAVWEEQQTIRHGRWWSVFWPLLASGLLAIGSLGNVPIAIAGTDPNVTWATPILGVFLAAALGAWGERRRRLRVAALSAARANPVTAAGLPRGVEIIVRGLPDAEPGRPLTAGYVSVSRTLMQLGGTGYFTAQVLVWALLMPPARRPTLEQWLKTYT